jgi:hypothetical protein
MGCAISQSPLYQCSQQLVRYGVWCRAHDDFHAPCGLLLMLPIDGCAASLGSMQSCTISMHVYVYVYVYVYMHVCVIVCTWGRRGVRGLCFLLLCWHNSAMLAHPGTPRFKVAVLQSLSL